MRNTSLKTKLIVLFAIPLVALVLIIYLSVSLTLSITSNFVSVADSSLPTIASVENLKFSASRLISSSNELIVENFIEAEEDEEEEEGGEEVEIDQIYEAIEAYNTELETYSDLLNNNPERTADDEQLLAQIETHGQTLIDTVTQIIELQEEEDSFDEVIELREELESLEVPFLDSLDTALQRVQQALESDRDSIVASTYDYENTVIVLLIATLAIVAGSEVYLLRSILIPLGNIRQTAEAIREGDLSARSKVHSDDELGQVAQAFNAMSIAIEYRDQIQIAKLEEQLIIAENAQTEAEQANKVKSSFLASMSHELRTPLNSIINFSKFLAKGVMGDVNEDQKETLDEIVMSGEHLLSLINDVLDISKIESNSLNLFIENDIDVDDLLSTAITTAQSLLIGKSVVLQSDIQPLPTIRADRQRILQVFLNVLSNACKFTSDGHITVTAEAQSDSILISVQDTGIGIAPEDYDKVFENFQQTDSGLRSGSGTGLGMPISKSLIEAHDGKLWFESEPGVGSTFYVSLPVKSENLVPTI